MWSILALGAVEGLIHHMVDLDAISRIQFNQLQGKMLRVVIDSPQLSVDVYFDDHKIRLTPTVTGQASASSIFEQRPFDPVHSIETANATLHVANVVELLKLLLADEVGTLPIQGDYRLLQDIQRIIQQAEPDLAAHLSPWIGPSVAHELAKIQQLPKQFSRVVSSKLFHAQDAIKEDAGLFAARWEMDELYTGTRQLNQNIERLEAKLQQLQSKLNPPTSSQAADSLATPHPTQSTNH